MGADECSYLIEILACPLISGCGHESRPGIPGLSLELPAIGQPVGLVIHSVTPAGYYARSVDA